MGTLLVPVFIIRDMPEEHNIYSFTQKKLSIVSLKVSKLYFNLIKLLYIILFR